MRDCRVASSINTSPTPRSSSVRIVTPLPPHLGIFHDPGHTNNLAARDDERPARAVAARHLGVDEHVLHLLRAAAQTVAGLPRAHLEPGRVGGDRPGAEADRAVLERDTVVLADGADPPAEIGLLRTVR